MPRTFTKEQEAAIDELAALFAEGSHDLMGMSYAISRAIRERLEIIAKRPVASR